MGPEVHWERTKQERYRKETQRARVKDEALTAQFQFSNAQAIRLLQLHWRRSSAPRPRKSPRESTLVNLNDPLSSGSMSVAVAPLFLLTRKLSRSSITILSTQDIFKVISAFPTFSALVASAFIQFYPPPPSRINQISNNEAQPFERYEHTNLVVDERTAPFPRIKGRSDRVDGLRPSLGLASSILSLSCLVWHIILTQYLMINPV